MKLLNAAGAGLLASCLASVSVQLFCPPCVAVQLSLLSGCALAVTDELTIHGEGFAALLGVVLVLLVFDFEQIGLL